MPNQAFSTLVPRTNPYVPGCPFPTIENALRDAAIKACEQTLAWRYEIPTYALLPGVHKYAFNAPVGSEVQAIFAAIVNSRPLALMNLDAALAKYPEWADLYSGQDPSVLWSETPSGALNEFVYNVELFNDGSPFVLPESIVEKASTPQAITQITPDEYVVLPLPDDALTYTMRMFVALKPKRSATSMDKDALENLEDLIIHRALQDLLIMPNVPWADREGAAYHARQYIYHKAERRAAANLGNGRSSLAVRNKPLG